MAGRAGLAVLMVILFLVPALHAEESQNSAEISFVSCRRIFQPVLSITPEEVHDFFEAFQSLMQTSQEYQQQVPKMEARAKAAEEHMDQLGQQYEIPKERGWIARTLNRHPDFSRARAEFHSREEQLKNFRLSFEKTLESQSERLKTHFKRLGQQVLEQAVTVDKSDVFWAKLKFNDVFEVDRQALLGASSQLTHAEFVLEYVTGRQVPEDFLGWRTHPELLRIQLVLDMDLGEMSGVILREPYTKKKSPRLFREEWVEDI